MSESVDCVKVCDAAGAAFVSSMAEQLSALRMQLRTQIAGYLYGFPAADNASVVEIKCIAMPPQTMMILRPRRLWHTVPLAPPDTGHLRKTLQVRALWGLPQPPRRGSRGTTAEFHQKNLKTCKFIDFMFKIYKMNDS